MASVVKEAASILYKEIAIMLSINKIDEAVLLLYEAAHLYLKLPQYREVS